MTTTRKHPVASLLCAALLASCGGGGSDGDTGTEVTPSPAPTIAINTAIPPGETRQVGDLDKGWLMQIPAGALGQQPVTLGMRTATAEDLGKLGAPANAQVLSLTAGGQHNVRLKAPVEIAARIPAALANAQPWELYYGYHTGKGWEYWPFKEVDSAAKVAVIETQHFSWLWGPVKLTQQERLQVYGRTMAAQYTQAAIAREALQAQVGPDLGKALDSLGIKDRAVIEDLSLNVISYLESAHISDNYALTANAALSPLESIATSAVGDADQREAKSLELVAKALHWALAKGGPDKWQAAGIASLGSLSTAAGALAGGDTAAAGPEIYSVLKGLVTTGAPGSGLFFAVGEAAVGTVQNAVDAFSASELEKAYQIYTGTSTGKGYYETGSGNIDELLAEMAGGGRQLELRIIENYCSKRMIKPCDLGERERELALDKGRASLKAYFEQRQKDEATYKAIEAQENAFLAELEKDQFLLKEGFYKDYFKDDSDTFNLEDRLQRIYNVRESLRRIFDGPNAATLSPRDMVLAIRSWMTATVEKKRATFYDWAIGQGYIAATLQPGSSSGATTSTYKGSMPITYKNMGAGAWADICDDTLKRILSVEIENNTDYSARIAVGDDDNHASFKGKIMLSQLRGIAIDGDSETTIEGVLKGQRLEGEWSYKWRPGGKLAAHCEGTFQLNRQ